MLLRLGRWIIRRPHLRVSAEQARAVARRDYDPKEEGFASDYEAIEHLTHWEVNVHSNFAGPVLARYEIDGASGAILSRWLHEL